MTDISVVAVLEIGFVFGLAASLGAFVAFYTVFTVGEWWQKYMDMVKEENK